MLRHFFTPWLNLFEFRGVTSRAEFYTYLISITLLSVPIAIAVFVLASFYEDRVGFFLLSMAPFELAFVVIVLLQLPLISLTARRLRGAGRSPWLTLLATVPLIGQLALLVLVSGSEHPPGPDSVSYPHD
jgi:uncharacterized membrane protein YhaH (DUF805 family)